ncbi:hypothetical protein CASFOL_030581 [Castilleja foliolosa]|uniref:Uncharacterized protein n=1 Tax=Castilleja foliolosa TaxID=1961234 RepID=A0ABD3C8P9_9LAMI
MTKQYKRTKKAKGDDKSTTCPSDKPAEDSGNFIGKQVHEPSKTPAEDPGTENEVSNTSKKNVEGTEKIIPAQSNKHLDGGEKSGPVSVKKSTKAVGNLVSGQPSKASDKMSKTKQRTVAMRISEARNN